MKSLIDVPSPYMLEALSLLLSHKNLEITLAIAKLVSVLLTLVSRVGNKRKGKKGKEQLTILIL